MENFEEEDYVSSKHLERKRTQLYLPLTTTISYNIIKEMSYLRKWQGKFPNNFLKNILPYFCWNVNEKELSHSESIYF